jgi:ParB family chromosome partitioning protein
MAACWQADDAFFELLRDKQVLTALVADVAGETVAAANAGEKTRTLKGIIRDSLTGANGRTKVEGWVPRWMAFPPAAYTQRGGVGTVEQAALVEAARQGMDEPDPRDPGNVVALAPEPQPRAEPERAAA